MGKSKTYDMTGVQSGGTFEPLPRGRYNLTSSEAVVETSSTGNEMISVTFDVAADQQYAGRKLFDRFVWTDNAMWKIKDVLEKIESPLSEDKSLSLEKLVVLFKRGVNVNVLVAVEPYTDKNGEKKTRNTISDYKAVPKGALPKSTGSTLFK